MKYTYSYTIIVCAYIIYIGEYNRDELYKTAEFVLYIGANLRASAGCIL